MILLFFKISSLALKTTHPPVGMIVRVSLVEGGVNQQGCKVNHSLLCDFEVNNN
jgi:hypothetical protein